MKKFNWQKAFADFKDTHDDLVITQPRDLFHVYGGRVLEWLAEEIEYEIRDGWCGSDTCFEDHKHKEMRQRINDYLEE